MKDDTELSKMLAVTAELTGTEMSAAAAEIMARELATYPRDQVLAALKRCRRELKGRLSMASIIERLDDGRPGAEEAFAMLPKTERESVVWTVEMSQAFGVCVGLMDSGDMVAARMAFKETYARMVTQAREQGQPVQWMPSLGHDPHGRASVLAQAVEKGRLSIEHARDLTPELAPPSDEALKRIGLTGKQLLKGPA